MNAAVSLIRKVDGRFLLVQERNPLCYGLWGFPGGWQEKGEQISNTAVREVREETGLFVANKRFVQRYKNTEKGIEGFVFFSAIIDGQEAPGPEIMAIGWFFPLEVREMFELGRLRGKYVQEILDNFLAERKFG